MKHSVNIIVRSQRKLRGAWTAWMLLAYVLFLASSAVGRDIPKLQGYVNDYADMISPETKSILETELHNFETSDSTQIVILTVPSLEGEDLEGFSIRVADEWKIGQKGKDNGVLFLVAKDEKKIRIEVGRGLEGRLTDLMAGRISDLVVKPRFKRGDFNGGFTAGIQALIDGTRGEFTAEDSRKSVRGRNHPEFLTFLIFGMIFILVVGNISRLFGAAAGALGVPALMGSFFGFAGLTLLLFGALGLVIGFILPYLFSSAGRSGRGGTSWPGGFFGGGFGGGGGGFGGGGFGGGGGGGFGGGGSSGGW